MSSSTMSITISNALLDRLKKHAVPLVDTFDTLINRLIDSFEAGLRPPLRVEAADTALSGLLPGLLPPVKSGAVMLADDPKTEIQPSLDAAINAEAGAHEGDDDPVIKKYDAMMPPDLTNTRILIAKFGDHYLPVRGKMWKDFFYYAVRYAAKRSEFVDLSKLLNVPFHFGNVQNESLDYLEDINISIKREAGTRAWKCISAIALHFQVPVKLVFEWRTTGTAPAYPGLRGELSIDF